ncbi:twitching motility protein [Gaiella occulta]|uniref:Twitching motility protein n=1 Tax=Gaiella occulta TaxID=1002870 RepID=A0A7M2YTU0_9ACTN|nr:type IV pilus twitching motility protein PilT [Gaiella occulta]RDI73562.1 twitching motility protein [Gaiella occulta]
MELSGHTHAAPLSVDALLERTVALGASDLHLTAGLPPAVRLHGRIEMLSEFADLTPEAIRELLYRITTTEQQKQLELKRQLDFAHGIRGLARFRVNVYYQRTSLAAAFRTIPVDIRSLEELGLPSSLHELANKPRGLVLVTGPTGSGKSTTLASIIDEINRTRSDHIITIEDPIEFLHRHKRCIVNQREVGEDATGFADALRGALRQDPDVILLGEMRDLETISTALTAAETGHLVFATLHTQSAPSTIDRIIDVFPATQQDQVRMQLASTLQGIVTQTLLPTVDGSGRACALEILFLDDAIRNLIRQGKIEQVYSYMQTGTRRGMQTMEQSLTELVQSNRISVQEAVGRSSRPEALVSALERAGVPIPALPSDGAPAAMPGLGAALRVAGS